MNDELPSSSKAIVWRRWLAAVADWIVIFLCCFAIGIAAETDAGFAWGSAAVVIALHVVVGFSYFTLLEHWFGRSPGKRLLGLRVVTAAHAPPGWGRAAGRAAFAWVAPTLVSDLLIWRLPWMPPRQPFPSDLVLAAAFAGLFVPAAVLFLPARTRNGFQAWHDRWTGTRVIGVGSLRAALVAASVSFTLFSLVMLAVFPPHRAWETDRLFVLSAAFAGGALVLALSARRLVPILFAGTTLTAVVHVFLTAGPSCCMGTQASAIGSLRAISSAQSTYAASCAGDGYATDLADLAKGPLGGAAFISPDLNKNGVVKSGYVFMVSRDNAAAVKDIGSPEKTCNGATGQPASSYFASANPVSKELGARYFATDSRGTIFFSTLGPIPNPIPPDATPIQ